MNADSVIKVIAFAQVTHDALPTTAMVCKTVGLAYDGSNPSPATTSGQHGCGQGLVFSVCQWR
jgi:hypothetical protein